MFVSLVAVALRRDDDMSEISMMAVDPDHAPARRTYEKAGFRMLSIARYFKMLYAFEAMAYHRIHLNIPAVVPMLHR